MILFPDVNPVAFHIGSLAVYWYGLMYLAGFLAGWFVLNWRLRHSSFWNFTTEQLGDILFFAALGVIIGGRLGYILFYDWHNFIADPMRLFQIRQGGMSFHGGLLGVLLALWICVRRMKKPLGDVLDFLVPAVPLGLALGRIGNFINGELWGRVSDVPWAMVFPKAGDMPRHPSQLYEFFLEGICLFIVLWIFSMRPKPRLAVSGLFLIGYGIARFSVEFFREPDVQIGYVALGWMTKGQLLSLPMIVAGIIMMVWAYSRGAKTCNNI